MSEDVKEQSQIFQLQLHVIEGEYKREPVPKPAEDAEFDERFIYPNKDLPYHNTDTITPKMGWVPITPTFSAPFKRKKSKKDKTKKSNTESGDTDLITVATTVFENHRFKTLQSLLIQGVKAEMRLIAFVQSEVIKYADCGSGVMIHKN